MAARWIFPVESPPLEHGTVTIAGEHIVAVEPSGQTHPNVDLGEVAILPGFVNAHTHLDLSGLRGQCPPTPQFTDWLREVIRWRRVQSPAEIERSIAAGLHDCLRFGTTLVGDITALGMSWDQVSSASAHAVVFYELLGLPKGRAEAAWIEMINWLKTHLATASCRPGVSPHAPYSVRSSMFAAAGTLGVPVAVHLAETAAELELLLSRRGPFVEFLRDLQVWDPEGLAEDPEHVLRLLNGVSPVTIAHGNFLRPDAPIPPNAVIVYCPRTHAAFGHPPHPFSQLLARGVRVALGTDSLASNPNLDVLAEARFLSQHNPDVAGATILKMATLHGAQALGWETETGSLLPGKYADLVVLPLPAKDERDPHELILRSSLPVQAVMWKGRWVHAAPGFSVP